MDFALDLRAAIAVIHLLNMLCKCAHVGANVRQTLQFKSQITYYTTVAE